MIRITEGEMPMLKRQDIRGSLGAGSPSTNAGVQMADLGIAQT